jgi:hypothetical protein
MSEILTVKLINGEHVVGHVKSEGVDFFELEKALIVGMMQNENGMTMGFAPISYLAPREDKGNKIKLLKSSILLYFDMDQELLDAYKQTVSSIITAPANLKIGR